MTRDKAPVTARAREIASRIDELPGKMRICVDADSLPDLTALQTSLNPTAIEVDCFPVYLFIEKHWSPAHAQRFMERVCHIGDGVRRFLEALTAISGGAPQEWLSRQELAKFGVVATLTAASVHSWADDIERHELSAAAGPLADQGEPRRAPAKVDVEPKEMVEGYKAIFSALGIKHRDQQHHRAACRAFKRKCEQNEAPVKFRDKKPPIAEKDALVEWWNSQLQAQEEREQAAKDRDVTLSNGYEHGRAGTEVKPGIAGYVRQRAN